MSAGVTVGSISRILDCHLYFFPCVIMLIRLSSSLRKSITQGSPWVLPRSMGLLAHKTALRQREIRCQVWYEYVASKANIADLPSRHDSQLAARLLRKRFRVPVTTGRPIRLPALEVAVQ